jgi:hypothetical protein
LVGHFEDERSVLLPEPHHAFAASVAQAVGNKLD